MEKAIKPVSIFNEEEVKSLKEGTKDEIKLDLYYMFIDQLHGYLEKMVPEEVFQDYASKPVLCKEKSKVIRIAYVGILKAGKSTLINSTLGQRLVTVGAENCTAITTFIEHSEKYAEPTLEKAISDKRLENFLEFLALKPERNELAKGAENVYSKLSEMQYEARDKKTSEKIYRFIKCKVRHFAGLMEKIKIPRLELVDLPGANEDSVLAVNNDAQFRDSLRFSDIFVCAMSSETPRNKAATENFFEVIAECCINSPGFNLEYCIIVVNKIDIAEEDEREKLKKSFCTWFIEMEERESEIKKLICKKRCGESCTMNCRLVPFPKFKFNMKNIFFLSAKDEMRAVNIENLISRGKATEEDLKDKNLKSICKGKYGISLTDLQNEALKSEIESIREENKEHIEYVKRLKEIIMIVAKKKKIMEFMMLRDHFLRIQKIVIMNETIRERIKGCKEKKEYMEYIEKEKGFFLEKYDTVLRFEIYNVNKKVSKCCVKLEYLVEFVGNAITQNNETNFKLTEESLKENIKDIEDALKGINTAITELREHITEMEKKGINCQEIIIQLNKLINNIAYQAEVSMGGNGWYIAGTLLGLGITYGGAIGSMVAATVAGATLGVLTCGLGIILFCGIAYAGDRAMKKSNETANKKYIEKVKGIISQMKDFEIKLFEREKVCRFFNEKIKEIKDLFEGNEISCITTIPKEDLIQLKLLCDKI